MLQFLHVETLMFEKDIVPSSGGSRISRKGAWTSNGGVDSQGGYISKILYVKTKESGPLGGRRAPGICQCRSATA